MILQEFSKTFRSYAAALPPEVVLNRWLKDILEAPPETNVEKIIHSELTLIEDYTGNYAIVGQTRSGQKLLEMLYKYILNLENQDIARWLHNLDSNKPKEEDQKE